MILTQGIFITFEGGEGAGKTTLIDGIEKELKTKKFSLVRTREPGGSQLGESIRSILLDKNQPPMSPYAELSLFLASRAQHIFEVIGPALEENKIVLCDRFNDSSIAYQGVARGLGMQKVAEVCNFFSEGLTPHLTFYLDIDPSIGLARVLKSRGQDRIEAETIAFHEKIREAYHQMQQKDPHRLILLNAENPPDVVLNQALNYIESIVKLHV